MSREKANLNRIASENEPAPPPADDLEEIILEEVAIDGICGVY